LAPKLLSPPLTSTDLSPEAAVAYIAAECERLSLPPGKIIDGAMLYRLSSAALRHFARLGWMHEVNHRLSEERGKPELQSDEATEAQESTAATVVAIRPPRPGTHPIRGRNPFGEWKPLAHIRIMVADKTMKALLDFTLVDIRYWRAKCDNQVHGWSKRREFCDRAEAAMVKAGVEEEGTLGALGAAELRRLSEAAREAWSAKTEE